MTELTCDLRKHLSNFQIICTKFNDNERNNKELDSMLQNLQEANAILKENDKKSVEQIKILRQICNEKVKAIAELHDFKTRNEILTQDNAGLQNLVEILKNKIDAIIIKNEEKVQSYFCKHKLEIDDMEDQFNKREKNLQEKIEVLQASFDLQISEKNNEKINLKNNFDEQLKKANDKEQHLKNELFRLNNQLSSSTAVLQKKILELEQKLKTSEREKSMFVVNQGSNFISANNVLRNFSNANPNPTTCNNDNNVEKQSQTRNSIIRNVSQTIENNTAKKFQFRKSNRSSSENVEKRLLSESFDPFEINKQINANNQFQKQINNSSKQMNTTNSSNRDVIYDIIEDNSENSTHSLQEYKLEEVETSVIDDKSNERKIVEHNQKNNTKRLSPSLKKRKLFNPKNMDYLN